jgi:hypothetical protein
MRLRYDPILYGLLLLFTFTSCQEDQDQRDYTPPVLSVTPVDIATVTSIFPFGADLSPGRKNPAFEYSVNGSDVQVRAVCGGAVGGMFLNDGFADYELWMQTSSDSVYFIHYDHVLNPNVTVGEEVAPGHVLGTVGLFNRTELQITNHYEGDINYCPFNFATDDFIQEHKSFTDEWCLLDMWK